MKWLKGKEKFTRTIVIKGKIYTEEKKMSEIESHNGSKFSLLSMIADDLISFKEKVDISSDLEDRYLEESIVAFVQR